MAGPRGGMKRVHPSCPYIKKKKFAQSTLNLYPPLAPGPHHQPKQGAQKQPAPLPRTCTPSSRAHYAQYAPPTDAAYPGQPAGYASVGGQATGYGGWAGLEPQLQAQPPYAPTALWHQEQAPAGYGKAFF